MVFQLHWQCIKEPEKTIWILQSETANHEDPVVWAGQQFAKRMNERPEGYQPMVCWEGSPHFVLGLDHEEKAIGYVQ